MRAVAARRTVSDPFGSSRVDWAHWALTGQYNAGTDNYAMTIYLNGVAVDWDGATGTTFMVPNAIIDNPGDPTHVTVHANSVVCALPPGQTALFVRLMVVPN